MSPKPVAETAAITAPGLRAFSREVPRAVVIAASTGGPRALATLMSELGRDLHHLPTFIVMHLPSEFVPVLATHVGRAAGRPALPAPADGIPQPGHIYIAPANTHLLVERSEHLVFMRHNDLIAENHRPAANVLFSSAAQAYGAGTLGIVLSGMGNDGREGARAIVAAGGSVIVQDQSTSICNGMPSAVINAGLACAELPIDRIAARIHLLFAARNKHGAVA